MKHPKAGQPVKIATGPLKGKYFFVSDYLTNQFQGKSIENILKRRDITRRIVECVKSRGFPLDSELVWGRLYPTMEWFCVHDKELQVEMQVVEGGGESVELPLNVEAMDKKRKPKAKPKRKEPDNDSGSAS